jgi:hypothetical protein
VTGWFYPWGSHRSNTASFWLDFAFFQGRWGTRNLNFELRRAIPRLGGALPTRASSGPHLRPFFLLLQLLFHLFVLDLYETLTVSFLRGPDKSRLETWPVGATVRVSYRSRTKRWKRSWRRRKKGRKWGPEDARVGRAPPNLGMALRSSKFRFLVPHRPWKNAKSSQNEAVLLLWLPQG